MASTITNQRPVPPADQAPRGRLHCVTRYDEDGDPYRKVCQCAATGGKNHEER